MLILGLLLVVVSGAAGVLLIAYNNGGAEQTVTLFGRDINGVTMMEAFVAGMVVTAVFLLGLWMIMFAGRKARENRARYREVRHEAKAAARERDQLAKQLREEEGRRDELATQNHDMRDHDVRDHHDHGVRNHDQNTETMVTPPAQHGAQPPRHTPPSGQQPVITNIKPGDSPTK